MNWCRRPHTGLAHPPYAGLSFDRARHCFTLQHFDKACLQEPGCKLTEFSIRLDRTLQGVASVPCSDIGVQKLKSQSCIARVAWISLPSYLAQASRPGSRNAIGFPVTCLCTCADRTECHCARRALPLGQHAFSRDFTPWRLMAVRVIDGLLPPGRPDHADGGPAP